MNLRDKEDLNKEMLELDKKIEKMKIMIKTVEDQLK